MKTVGLITEYNPFHNGHLYHLQRAKEISGADFVVVVMSGDFVQRGFPAITDKFTRASMALSEGADLVLELPSCYATASAEFFALGAVSLLEQLGCVDSLVFGSECGDISKLSSLADLFVAEPAHYKAALKEGLALGMSYPAARIHALQNAMPEFSQDVSALLEQPNNILGIEYLKALKKLNSSIKPYTLQRSGGGYHQETVHDTLSSATAIRRLLLSSKQSLEQLKEQIPENAYGIFCDAFKQNPFVDINDFSEFLSYSLIMNQDHLTDYLDIDEALANRICNHLYAFTNISEFADLLKNKAYTHTRITRALCHILLNSTKEHMELFLEDGISFYGRALGFRRLASPLLKAVKEHTSIPFLTKLAGSDKVLTETGKLMLAQDLRSSQLYRTVQKKDMAYNEYTTPLILR